MSDPKALSVLIMVPTLNERENIAALLTELLALSIPALQIVVIDDQSSDGTAEAVERMIRLHPQALRLIRRQPPPGRGLAGREGFLDALKSTAQYWIEMDGDFSHQPRHVPQLLEAMKSCDVAVGSRFVQGGCDGRKAAARRWLTLAANFYARGLLNLPVADVNSGFRCFSRKALESLAPQSLKSRGPSILHESLFRAARAGLRIREVPIEFVDRRGGESKLNGLRLGAGFFWVLKMRYLP
ncbi:MAG: hypothetical protein A3J74_01530 [Elusimicrobia bacterium RIFCSPHIGHO2_02_FULL_57_9]|nr:MAG: hypothetical protein A3J74_01530 [Elusimicrobia bacterium RIFCSPHIGHO2_02_FULL_57_9]